MHHHVGLGEKLGASHGDKPRIAWVLLSLRSRLVGNTGMAGFQLPLQLSKLTCPMIYSSTGQVIPFRKAG